MNESMNEWIRKKWINNPERINIWEYSRDTSIRKINWLSLQTKVT